MSKSKGESKCTAAVRSQRGEGKERKWRRIIEEQQRCEESVRAFCRERQLHEASFYRWRRKMGLRDREVASRQQKKNSSSFLAPVVFVEEPCGGSARSRETSMDETSPAIEIVLNDGITVRIGQHSTDEQLGMVLSVLEQRRC